MLLHSYQINLLDFNTFFCKFMLYIVPLLTILYATVLILASIDRLLISSQNVDTRLYSSKRLAYFSIGSSCLFWIVYNSHLLFKVHIQEMTPSIFKCYYDLSGIYLHFISYSTLIINCIFLISMISLLIITFQNIRHIRLLPRRQVRRMTKKDFQLLRCLFMHDIVYLIFSTPLVSFYTYIATQSNGLVSSNYDFVIFLTEIASFIQFIPTSTSFLIFFFVSKAFRQEIKRLIYKLTCKNLPPTQDNEVN